MRISQYDAPSEAARVRATSATSARIASAVALGWNPSAQSGTQVTARSAEPVARNSRRETFRSVTAGIIPRLLECRVTSHGAVEIRARYQGN
jgi:hypothetical protein